MSDPNVFISKGKLYAEKAIEFDTKACRDSNPDDFNKAKDNYLLAIEHYMAAKKYTKNEHVKASLLSKINTYMDRTQIMKEWLAEHVKNEKLKAENEKKGKKPSSGGGTAAARKGDGNKDGNDADEEQERMQSQLGSAILSEKPNVRWDDVAGLEGAKEALKEAVIFPQRFPQMFTGKRKPWRGILLFGPPGTGKSYLAKALATEADSQFFSVSSSDLVSKWQGESEKLVKELFSMARKAGKAIIFIDEIDALVSSRSENESESSRRIKNEFLVQMDGVGKSSDGVLLLGATNIPWGLDDALLRRMERRVYIPLPDVFARARMFEIHLGNTPHELKKDDFKDLANMSDGYSGSDIGVVVRDAIMQPVRTLQNATFFKYVTVEEEGKGQVRRITPCSPSDPDGREMQWMDVNPEELMAPTVTKNDFIAAIQSSKPSVGKDTIHKHEEFTSEKGLSGV